MKRLNSKFKTAVLAGGVGSERDVSLQSGKCVAQALKQASVNVVLSDISPDKLDILEDGSIDVFFIALHGEFGEDGQLQQILENKSLIYTGSGSATSRLAFDKMASKKAFTEAGTAVPRAIEFDSDTDVEQLSQLGDKYVIKPIRQGSSFGVSILSDRDAAIEAGRKCLEGFDDCMIEEFIQGREITVGVLCGQALPIIEIRTNNGFYDYHSKYLDDRTEYLFDTITDPTLIEKIKSAAMDCFNSLELKDFGRVDFVLSEEKEIYVLEANTIPGFTTHSLLPKAAAKAGVSMSNLCLQIVEAAMNNG